MTRRRLPDGSTVRLTLRGSIETCDLVAMVDDDSRNPRMRERPPVPAFLNDGGEMGARIRSYHWESTTLGSPHGWPGPLRTVIRMMLSTNHPIFAFWGDELTCFYNDAYAASLGPEKHPQSLGQPGRDVWREIWPVIGPQIEFVQAGRGATWHEDHLVPITRNGRVEDVYWTYGYGPIHDDNAPNEVGGVLVLCRETTNRVTEAARVQADLDRYRLLFEQSPGFICVLRGPEHRFEYCNQTYQDLFGSDTPLVGRTVSEVFPEVQSQGFTELLNDVYRTGEAHTASEARLAINGAERWVDFVYQPLRDRDDAVNGVLVQGVDVTARKLAQAALQRSASRLHIATEAANLGIHEYDIRANTIVWDARVRALWGIPDTEVVTYDVFMAGVVPEDRDLVQLAVDQSTDPTNGGSYQVEYRVRDRRGVTRWIRATGRVEFEAATPLRLVGIVQDISAQKRNEEALIAADRKKDVFLATLAHELRNPLAPITNAALVLTDAGISVETAAWAQQVIERQARHMASLLDDLLDVARLTQGKFEMKREPVALRTVLNAALETVAPQLQAKRHRLSVTDVDPDVVLFADPVRLSQVFTNLLGNAIKYMDPGGSIAVAANRSAHLVSISVKDSGIGLDTASLSRVFGMFEQSEASLERAEGGLGIGLAIVRAIVELHGGTIQAHSEGPGTGSEFVAVLPLAPAPADPAQRLSDTPSASTTPLRTILLADDNHDSAESLAVLLGLRGHLVRVASDGLQALEIAKASRPDIVILDIGMPGMNGYEVARALRSEVGSWQPRLIALTGWGQGVDRQRSADAGFDVHLTKPADLQALLDAIGH